MLDIKNQVLRNLNANAPKMQRFIRLKGLMDTKANTYLQWTATKNMVNRASDYHYLGLAVTDSTAPVNGIDYIHPSVKPAVDYATAVITKGLAPNGEINFEFTADHEGDAEAARQATEMVSKVINEMNDPHFVLNQWVMDACMHKNGMMMIKPVREQITRYVTTSGTADQLRAFEQQAMDSGLQAVRQSRRRQSVDMAQVAAETAEFMSLVPEAQRQAELDSRIAQAAAVMEGLEPDMSQPNVELATGEDVLAQSIARNTIYTARYRLTGYSLNIQFRSIAQHYWLCDLRARSTLLWLLR